VLHDLIKGKGMRVLAKLFVVLALGMIVCTPALAAPVVLSDNLFVTENISIDIADAGGYWIGSILSTDGHSYALDTVTLLIKQAAAGNAQVEIYTNIVDPLDGLCKPGALVGTLTPPASYTPDFAHNTFTASDILLDPNSTYWVVLKALSGEFQWQWTTVNTGSGVGFSPYWGCKNSGIEWYTEVGSPYLMSVAATPAPLPPGLLLLGSGLLGLAGWRRFGKG
jgi:hypothetical protein